MTAPGQAVLFYGWQSLGGLSLGEVQDATFTLSGAIGWVCKQAHLNTNPMSWVKAGSQSPKPSPNKTSNPEDPGIPAPFSLHHYHLTLAIRISPHGQQSTKMQLNDGKLPGMTQGHHTRNKAVHYKKTKTEARSNETNRPPHPHCLCPHQDCGFESDQTSVLISSSVSLRSDRSGGSRHSHHVRQCHRESGGHMKINLPIFKDKDMKDVVTYQSWCWDSMVYQHTGY